MQTETAQDRANEVLIAERLEQIWPIKMYPMKTNSSFDFTIVNRDTKRVVAFAEIRKLSTAFNDYPTIFCSESKLETAKFIDQNFKAPPYFIVQWSDCVGLTKLLEPVDAPWGRREPEPHWNRRPGSSMATVALIPTNIFKILP